MSVRVAPVVQISHKLNTIQNMHNTSNAKTYKHNPKVSPFGIALVQQKINWQIKLGDAGTTDPFRSFVSVPDYKQRGT